MDYQAVEYQQQKHSEVSIEAASNGYSLLRLHHLKEDMKDHD
ncbi:hypothetical protein [Paenibacillus massiliensis]|nr:hypothetical protein [Paenibacillus massiliensis]